MIVAAESLVRKSVVPPWADRGSLYRLFAFACVLTLIANACSLFLFPFSIDAEAYAFDPEPTDFIGSGRWAAYLLIKYLVPYPSIPVVPILIACLSLSLAYVVTAYTWDSKIGWPHYLAATLALCHPVLFQLLSFYIISYAVCLGILSCAFGLYVLSRGSPVTFVASVLLFTFGLGIYQPIALFPCAAFLAGAGLGLDQRGMKQTLIDLLMFGASISLAVALNYVVTKIYYYEYSITTSYIESYFDFDYLRQHFFEDLGRSWKFAEPILFGFRGPFITKCTIYKIAIVSCGVSALVCCIRLRRSALGAALSIGLIFGAVLFSVMPPLISGGVLPYRVMLGTPIALAGVVFCAGRIRFRPTRAVLGILVALSFVALAQIGSRLYYSSYLVWLDDRALGEAIFQRIDALPDLPAEGPIRVEFVGFHEWPKSGQIIDVGADSIMGRSFFEQDGGNPGRMVLFLRTLGRFDIELPSSKQRAAIRSRVDAMPAWPRPGSVRLIDGIVVVRFGPYTQFEEQM